MAKQKFIDLDAETKFLKKQMELYYFVSDEYLMAKQEFPNIPEKVLQNAVFTKYEVDKDFMFAWNKAHQEYLQMQKFFGTDHK